MDYEKRRKQARDTWKTEDDKLNAELATEKEKEKDAIKQREEFRNRVENTNIQKKLNSLKESSSTFRFRSKLETVEKAYEKNHLDVEEYNARKQRKATTGDSGQGHDSGFDFKDITKWNGEGLTEDKKKELESKYQKQIGKEIKEKNGNARTLNKNRAKMAGLDTNPQGRDLSPDEVEKIADEFNKFKYADELSDYESDEDFSNNYYNNRKKITDKIKIGRSLQKYYFENTMGTNLGTALMTAMARTETLVRIAEYMDLRATLITNPYYINLSKDMFEKLSAAEIDAQLANIIGKGDLSNYDLIEFLAMAYDLKSGTVGISADGKGRNAFQRRFLELNRKNWEKTNQNGSKTNAYLRSDMTLQSRVNESRNNIKLIMVKKTKIKMELSRTLDRIIAQENAEKTKAAEEQKKEKETKNWEYRLKKLNITLKSGEKLDPAELEKRINETKLNGEQQAIADVLNGKKYENNGKDRNGNMSVIKTIEHRVSARRKFAESYVEKYYTEYTANLPSEKKFLVDKIIEQLIKDKTLTAGEINVNGKKSDPVTELLRDGEFIKKVAAEHKNVAANYKKFTARFKGLSDEKKNDFYSSSYAKELFNLDADKFNTELKKLQSARNANIKLIRRILGSYSVNSGEAPMNLTYLVPTVVSTLSYDVLNASIEDITSQVRRVVQIRKAVSKNKGIKSNDEQNAKSYNGIDAELRRLIYAKYDSENKTDDKDSTVLKPLDDDDSILFTAIKKNPDVVKVCPEITSIDNVESLSRLKYGKLDEIVSILVNSIVGLYGDKEWKNIETGHFDNETRERIQNKILLAKMSGSNEKLDSIVQKAVDEVKRENEQAKTDHEGMLLALSLTGFNEAYSLDREYLNINVYGLQKNKADRDTILDRSFNLGNCEKLWDYICSKDLAADLLERIREKGYSASGLGKWYDSLDRKTKDGLDEIAVIDSKVMTFKDYLKDYSAEFCLCATHGSFLGKEGEGSEYFLEAKDNNYHAGLKRSAKFLTDRMILVENYLKENFIGQGLDENQLKRVRFLRRGLRRMAGGMKDTTGLKGVNLAAAREYNRNKYGAATFEEAMAYLTGYYDLDEFKKDTKGLNSKIRTAAAVIKDQTFSDDLKRKLFSTKIFREKIVALGSHLEVEKWMRDEFVPSVTGLAAAMEYGKNGYMLRYFCMTDLEKTLKDCLDNKRDAKYWDNYRKECEKKFATKKSYRKKKTAVQAVDDAKKYADKYIKDHKLGKTADSVDDILKKGYTMYPRYFECVLTSERLMKQAVENLIDEYMNGYKQIMDILNAEATTKDLSEDIKNIIIKGVKWIGTTDTFSDADKDSIKALMTTPEEVEKAVKMREQEEKDGWVIIGGNELYEEYYKDIADKKKAVKVYKDKDLNKLIGLNGLLDSDRNIYFAMRSAKDGKEIQEYTSDEAKEYLTKIDESLASMLHSDELTANLKNFMAGFAYENRNSNKFDLKQELRFMIGVYRAQYEYYNNTKERYTHENPKPQDVQETDAQNKAEKAAIFAFMSITDHHIDKNADTITKYDFTRSSEVTNGDPKVEFEDGWVVVNGYGLQYVKGENIDLKKGGTLKNIDVIDVEETDAQKLYNEFYLGDRKRDYLSDMGKVRYNELAKKRYKEKYKKDLEAAKKALKQKQKNMKFEEKHPQYMIPKFSMSELAKNGTLDRKIHDITEEFDKKDELFAAMTAEYKTIENPAIKEEYRNFLKAMQMGVCTMSLKEFEDIAAKRRRYFSYLTKVVNISKDLVGEENRDENITAIRDYFRDELSKASATENYQFKEAEWTEKIKDSLSYKKDELARLRSKYEKTVVDANKAQTDLENLRDQLSKATVDAEKTRLGNEIKAAEAAMKKALDERFKLRHKIDSIEENRLQNFVKEGQKAESKASENYYFGQKTQEDFNKLLSSVENKAIKESFGKLNDQEKLLLASILSVTATSNKTEKKEGEADVKNINNLVGSEFALTSMEDVKKAIDAYIKSKKAPEIKIDYDAVIRRLLGQIPQDEKGVKIDENAFNTAMTILDATRVKKDNNEAPSLKLLGDASVSNEYAKTHNMTPGFKLAEFESKYGDKFGIDSVDAFILRIKNMQLDDLKRSGDTNLINKTFEGAHNFIERVNINDLSARLTRMMDSADKTELRMFVLFMQDRTVLDYKSADKAEAFIKGEQIERVNTLKRDMLMGHILAGGDKANDLMKHASDNMAMVNAVKTLLSFQMKDHCKADGKGDLDYEEYSFHRSTAMDWELIKHAFEFIDEIKTEQRKYDIVRKASSREFIERYGSIEVRSVYGNLTNGINQKEFLKRISDTIKPDSKENELLDAYKSLNGQQKALFVRALKHRDVLDISRTGSITNAIFGFERNYVNPAERYSLIDEYVTRSESERAILDIGENGYTDALKSLLSTQIDDSLNFASDEGIHASKLTNSTKRSTTIDWQLFSNALQFVFRADEEKKTMYEDRALYETMGDLEANGEFKFDAAFLRRNLHTSMGKWRSFTMSRLRTNVAKYIPDNTNARTLLSYVLNVKTMNSLNKYMAKPGTTGSKVNDLGTKYKEFEVHEAKKAKLQEKLDAAKKNLEDNTDPAQKEALEEKVKDAQKAYDANLTDMEKYKKLHEGIDNGTLDENEGRIYFYGQERLDNEKNILITDTVNGGSEVVSKFKAEELPKREETDTDEDYDKKMANYSKAYEEQENLFDAEANNYTTRINIPTKLGLRSDLSSIVDVVKDMYGNSAAFKSAGAVNKNGSNFVTYTDSQYNNSITISTAVNKDGQTIVRVSMTTTQKVNTQALEILRNKLSKAVEKAEDKGLVNKVGMKATEINDITRAKGGTLQSYNELSGIISIIMANSDVDSEFVKQLGDASKQLNENIMLFQSEEMNGWAKAAGFDVDAFVGLAASGMCQFLPKEEVEKITKAYKGLSDTKKYVTDIATKWLSDADLSEKITDVEYAKIADIIMENITAEAISNHKDGIKLAANTLTALQKTGSKFMKYLKSKDKPLLMDSESEVPTQINGFDTNTNPVDQFGIDTVFDLLGEYSKLITAKITDNKETAEKAKTGVADIKKIMETGSGLYTKILNSDYLLKSFPLRQERRDAAWKKAQDSYNEYVTKHPEVNSPETLSKEAAAALEVQKAKLDSAKKTYESGNRDDARLKRYTEAAKNAEFAKSLDLQSVGELTSLFLSKENAELCTEYSGLINQLKDFAADTYAQMNKNNAIEEGIASINMTSLLEYTKKYADKSTAMKWIMRGVGSAQIANKTFGIFLKNMKDEVMLDGKYVRKAGESKDWLADGITHRDFGDMMNQFGINELFDIVKIIGICAPSKETSEMLIKIAEAKETVTNIMKFIPAETWGDMTSGQLWSVLGAAGGVGGLASLGIYKGLNDEQKKQLEKGAAIIGKTVEDLSKWSTDEDVWSNLAKLKAEGILDLSKDVDPQSVIGTTARVLKGVSSLYGAMYQTVYLGKGIAKFGGNLFDYKFNSENNEMQMDILTEKILTRFEGNALVGGKMTDLYKSGALKNMVKSGKIVSENVGNAYTFMKDVYNRYQVHKARTEAFDNEFEDRLNLYDGLADDEKFMQGLGNDMAMTDEEKKLAMAGLQHNSDLTKYGLDYAGTGITMDMVDNALRIVGSITKYTAEPAGLINGILTEAGQWMKFFGQIYRDSTVADEYFANGPGKAMINKIKLEYAGHEKTQSEYIAIAKTRMGFGKDYENDMAFRTYIGRNIVQSILFSASAYNPMKGLRLKSQLILKVLGLDSLVGKTDMASAMQLYDKLIGNMGINLSGLAGEGGVKTDGSQNFEINDIYKHIPAKKAPGDKLGKNVPPVQNKLKAGA